VISSPIRIPNTPWRKGLKIRVPAEEKGERGRSSQCCNVLFGTKNFSDALALGVSRPEISDLRPVRAPSASRALPRKHFWSSRNNG